MLHNRASFMAPSATFRKTSSSLGEESWLKTKTFLKKTGELFFYFRVLRMNVQHFHTKLPCQKPMLR